MRTHRRQTILRTGLLLVLPSLGSTLSWDGTGLAAQQLAVEEASGLAANTCQLEGWVGAGERSVTPSCRFLPATELGLGLTRAASTDHTRSLEVALQAKVVIRDPEESRWGWGVVAGAVAPGADGGGRRRLGATYAYLPVSAALDRVPLALHLNLGWEFQRRAHDEGDRPRHHGLWGGRADLALRRWVTVLAEASGLTGQGPDARVGLRFELLADRVHMDLTQALPITTGHELPGPQLGLAWTPASFRFGS